MNLNGTWKLYYYENGSVTANTPAELAAAKVAQKSLDSADDQALVDAFLTEVGERT